MQAIAKQENLKVDYIPTKGGRGMVQLVISGQVDFAYSGVFTPATPTRF